MSTLATTTIKDTEYTIWPRRDSINVSCVYEGKIVAASGVHVEVDFLNDEIMIHESNRMGQGKGATVRMFGKTVEVRESGEEMRVYRDISDFMDRGGNEASAIKYALQALNQSVAEQPLEGIVQQQILRAANRDFSLAQLSAA